MRKLIVTGGCLGADPKEVKSGLFAPVAVKSWGRMPDGSYGNKTIWITCFFPNNEFCKKLKKGNAVQLMGTFDYAVAQNNGKDYLNIMMNVQSVEYARGSNGGLLSVVLSNVGAVSDILDSNGHKYVRCVFSTKSGDNAEDKRWGTLFLSDELASRAQAMKIAKGSQMDIIATPRIELSEYNGKTQVNATYNVVALEYANSSGKKKDEGSSASSASPAPSTSHAAAPSTPKPTAMETAPSAPADDGFFSESTEEEFF